MSGLFYTPVISETTLLDFSTQSPIMPPDKTHSMWSHVSSLGVIFAFEAVFEFWMRL